MSDDSAVEYDLESCAWCSGSGRESSGEKCVVCIGTRSVQVPQPSRRCPACRCTGRDDAGRPCDVCDGTGWEGARRRSDGPRAVKDTRAKFEEFFRKS